MRITSVKQQKFGESPKIIYYKDGKEFARVSLDAMYQIRIMKGINIKDEVLTALKYELDDPSLEGELEKVIDKYLEKL